MMDDIELAWLCGPGSLDFLFTKIGSTMMNLFKLLVSKYISIIIIFVVTEEWLGFLATEPESPPSILFETLSNLIPLEKVRANDFPEFIQAVAIFTNLEEPFERVAVGNEEYSGGVGGWWGWGMRNIPVVSLWTMSPSVFAVFNHFELLKENGHFPAELSDMFGIYMESMRGGGGDVSRNCHVVAMPYPGRGHINPMMNLCKLLVSKSNNIIVSFVVTEEWRGFLDSAHMPPSIRFETIPNVIPSELVRADDIPGFVEAVMTKLEGPFEQVLNRILSPVTAIITVMHLSWVAAVGNQRNIPVAALYPMSPTMFSICSHYDLVVQRGHSPAYLSECGDERIDYIPGISSIRLADLPMNLSKTGQAVLPDLTKYLSWTRKPQCLILTSFYELEQQVTDNLKSTLPFPVYSVGPLVPYMSPDNAKTNKEDIHYFKWLDSQPPKSVLYISLGSFLSVSREQMDEIVAGVHGSGVRYLWVARGDSSHIQEACSETGLVVPWCDQLKVLCHSSVGGFWTHCGWNSTLEGVFAGAPMLTFPIMFDQITNRKLIVDDWKVGVKVKEVATGKLVKREEITIIVKKFMDLEEDESKETRRRASDLQEKCRQAVAKGGSSDENLDAFITEILQFRN